MKYYIDSEFMEDGKTIEILSLSIVKENGRGLYLVNTSADRTKANDWVKQNVVPQLDDFSPCILGDLVGSIPISEFVGKVLEFVDEKPEFWGYYAAYDWVSFCQIFGMMVDLPKGWPMFCRDIIQECKRLGNPTLPPQGKGEHHCLLDARWNKQAHEYLLRMEGQ